MEYSKEASKLRGRFPCGNSAQASAKQAKELDTHMVTESQRRLTRLTANTGPSKKSVIVVFSPTCPSVTSVASTPSVLHTSSRAELPKFPTFNHHVPTPGKSPPDSQNTSCAASMGQNTLPVWVARPHMPKSHTNMNKWEKCMDNHIAKGPFENSFSPAVVQV